MTPRGPADTALQALRSLPGMMVVAYDRELRILLATGSRRAWRGQDPEALGGVRLAEALDAETFASLAGKLRGPLRGRVETFSHRLAEEALDLEITLAPLRDARGEVVGGTAAVRVDEGIALLRRFAEHDTLTGLLTRERLHDELSLIVAAAARDAEPGVVGVLDLDNFKYVNDAHGHGIGDHVLTRVANVLQDELRESDVVGRLGSDEFAFVLPQTDLPTAHGLVGALLRALREDSGLAGAEPFRVTASVGLAPIEPETLGDAGVAELLARADIAMYAAKEAGRDRVAQAAPGQRDLHRVRVSLQWSERIRRALAGDGFVLHAQPIFDLAEHRVDCHELLLRMVDDDGSLVAPGEFLSTAERFGQMPAIDRWVIGRAVDLLGQTPEEETLTVNLSAASVTDAETVAFVSDRVLAAGIDPRRLIFEITETAAIADIVRAGVLAERLRELGCRFALDDFGAGFGSLRYLKHLPFDVIKIDGEFVKDLPDSPGDRLTVAAIAQMARGLGKTTIAEFVQNPETIDLLRELGVDFAQGVHIGMPEPVGVRLGLGRHGRPG